MFSFLRIAAIIGVAMSISHTAKAENHLGWSPVRSDTLHIASSNDIIGAVLASNMSYEAFLLRAEAAGYRTEYAGVYPDPVVMVTGQPFPVYTARGKQVAGLRIEQTIPFPGKQDIMRRIADLEAELGRNAANNFVVDVVLEAQLALNNVRHGQELQRQIHLFAPRLDELRAIATTKYEGGEGTQQSLFKIQLEKARFDQMWLEQERIIRSGTNQIERLVQQPVHIDAEASVWGPGPVTGLELASRSDLEILEKTRLMALERQKLLGFYTKPDFMVSMNWIAITEADMPPTSDGRDALALGVGVRIPLWPSGNKARLQEASLAVEASEKQIEASRKAIEDMYEEIRTNLDSDTAIFNLIETSLLVTAEAVSESAISSYATGMASFMDLLDAKRSLFQLQLDRVHVQARLGASVLLLNRISGRLNRAVSEINR